MPGVAVEVRGQFGPGPHPGVVEVVIRPGHLVVRVDPREAPPAGGAARLVLVEQRHPAGRPRPAGPPPRRRECPRRSPRSAGKTYRHYQPGCDRSCGPAEVSAFPRGRRPRLCLQIRGSEHPKPQTNRCVPGGGAADFMIMARNRCYLPRTGHDHERPGEGWRRGIRLGGCGGLCGRGRPDATRRRGGVAAGGPGRPSRDGGGGSASRWCRRRRSGSAWPRWWWRRRWSRGAAEARICVWVWVKLFA